MACSLAALPITAVGQLPQGNGNQAALLNHSPAKLSIWTDSLGYATMRHMIRAYLEIQPMHDSESYFQVVYLENVANGAREYWKGWEAGRVTAIGPLDRSHTGTRIKGMASSLIWTGRLARPGAWRIVAEFRSMDQTVLVKRAMAGFLVTQKMPLVLGEGGTATEILSDTTWKADQIRVLHGPVHVRDGATLTLEAGALVLARGAPAAIVVERGARIVANGRPEAPVILTCEAMVGEREPGCWGGLVLLGQAPTGARRPQAPEVDPPGRGLYGGDVPDDSSGVLRYVRVEFAGAGSGRAGIGFYGVGSGTVIDHLQSHASGGVGIRLAGGTSDCRYCVASGSAGHGIAWEGGWSGRLQHVYVQQPGGCGIEASTRGLGLAEAPVHHPQAFGVTLVKSSETRNRCEAGIMFGGGAAAIVRNLAVHGFGGGAVRFEDAWAKARFAEAGGSIAHVIARSLGDVDRRAGPLAQVFEQDPELTNVRWESFPTPTPRRGSLAMKMGSAASPPADGWFDTNADYVGAFGIRNWLQDWAWLGPEPYLPPAP